MPSTARILTICPTRNRPELCKQMVESWHNTITGNNTLVLGFDITEPKMTSYHEIRNANRVMCKHESTVTETINSIYVMSEEYDFYHITNDDVIYRTKGWDTMMVKALGKKGGIAYGNDLFQKDQLPTFPFISANVAKATGFLQLPTLNRYCGDTVWGDIGSGAKCLHYLGAVVIEHMHKLAGKGKDDVDMPVFQKDWHAYVTWNMTARVSYVQLVKEALNGIS